jgi:hypothetical protein
MNDVHKVPMLFAVPSPALWPRVLALTAISVPLSFLLFLCASVWPGFPYFSLMSGLLLIHGLLAFRVSGGNLLWMFRYGLVFILIAGTAFVWSIYGGTVFVAPFGLEHQNHETTRILVQAGFLSLSGSLFGWCYSNRRFKPKLNSIVPFPPTVRTRLRIAGFILAIGFSFFYVYTSGGLLIGGYAYNSRKLDVGFEFGVFNIFHFIGIALLVLSGIHKAGVMKSTLIVAIATLAVGVLTGSRADFLPQAFLLFLLLFNPGVQRALESRRTLAIVGWTGLFILITIIGYISASLVGIWRSGFGLARAFELIFGQGADRLFVSNVYGHPMLYLETGNMMLGSFYAAIVNSISGTSGYLWGESYLNYILTAPPAFLGLPRPLGLEWFVSIDGLMMAQGGIFEPAEAFWNFGFAGCFAVSFLLSYCFGWLLMQGLSRANYFYLTWYIVFGLHSFRSIWYQNFSYFRLFTIMLLIFVFASLFFNWFTRNRLRVSNKAPPYPT